ncbi:hypothetical protein SADUNF_Sadunf06G0074000 [Salix dunnii]|uniref:Uncharacterized protein n=1 Tax=Salix dunnii TaxID=1413687 RepID=A0A835K604_9ROSI|nr:hypothetical protein SADUNF_Sadunf06G0074000 [Salix dunnii]
MAFYNFSPASIFLLIHFALFSRLFLAANPTISYDFKLSYIIVSPLGVPQKSVVWGCSTLSTVKKQCSFITDGEVVSDQ